MTISEGLGLYHMVFIYYRGSVQSGNTVSVCSSAVGVHRYLCTHQLSCIHCIEVRFASFISGGFITATLVNPPERKLAKRTSVQYMYQRRQIVLLLYTTPYPLALADQKS